MSLSCKPDVCPVSAPAALHIWSSCHCCAGRQRPELAPIVSLQNAYRWAHPTLQTSATWHALRRPAAIARVKVNSVLCACSLLCRTFDTALAECCHAEGVGMLAYSPLAMGLLTVRLSPAALSRSLHSA